MDILVNWKPQLSLAATSATPNFWISHARQHLNQILGKFLWDDETVAFRKGWVWWDSTKTHKKISISDSLIISKRGRFNNLVLQVLGRLQRLRNQIVFVGCSSWWLTTWYVCSLALSIYAENFAEDSLRSLLSEVFYLFIFTEYLFFLPYRPTSIASHIFSCFIPYYLCIDIFEMQLYFINHDTFDRILNKK